MYSLLLLSGSAKSEIAIVGPEFALWWTGDACWSVLVTWCGDLLTGDGECVECLIEAGEDGLDIPSELEKNVMKWLDIDENISMLPDVCDEFKPEFLVGLWYEADRTDGVDEGDLRLWFLVLL